MTQTVYNVTSFSPTAQELFDWTLQAFPQADIRFAPDCHRQGIVDSWPADIDDTAARRDWVVSQIMTANALFRNICHLLSKPAIVN